MCSVVSIYYVRARETAAALIGILFGISGCGYYHPRPKNVPASATRANDVFIDCTVEWRLNANRCTVYKADSGRILADGLFRLISTEAAADSSELKFAAYAKGTIYLADARFLVLVYPSQRDPEMRLIFDTLKNLATHGVGHAIDCTDIPDNGKAAELSKCAMRAFAEHHAFIVRYYRTGIDSVGWHALAGDTNGNVTEVDYDSMGWMARNLPTGFEYIDDNHIIIAPCPLPVALAKYSDSSVSCVRPPKFSAK